MDDFLSIGGLVRAGPLLVDAISFAAKFEPLVGSKGANQQSP